MRHRIVTLPLAALIAAALVPVAGAQTPDLGQVEFPNSGEPAAQPAFLRGILLLHSFEYPDAAEAFREAQRIDPGFALAYWGEAMTYNHPIWQQQDREAALAALRRLGPTPAAREAKARTEREKDYLRALEVLYGDGEKRSRDFAYADAMRRLREKYPDDHEAAAFYALALLGTAHEGRDIPIYMRAAAVVEEVFRDNPQHPGAAHYMIHSYDDPVHAPLGLRAARAYSKIAPAASHAQHMTSHIFIALGMWDEVVTANETAWNVADERVKRKGLSSDARNAHALRWLAYGYMQQGRYEDARRRLEIMRKDAEASGSPRARSYLALMRADYLVNTQRWTDDAVGLEVDLRGLSLATAANSRFASGLAALRVGDRARAESVVSRLKEERESAARSGEYPPDVQAVRVLELELRALLSLEDGKADEALELMEEATSIESQMPFEFGPPFIVKPSPELLGEMLLELDRPAEARQAFVAALQRAPRRTASLLGLARAAARAGDTAIARETYETLRLIWRRADPALPYLAEVASR